jgi:ParB family chromosome partitioning protein
MLKGKAELKCPRCGLDIRISKDAESVQCPYCENITYLPSRDQKLIKRCPFCKEQIANDALKCRFCGEFVEKEIHPPRQILGILKRLFFGDKKDNISYIPLARIESNPFQPREVVEKRSISALARSVKEYGVIVPIIVTRVKGGYQLVAGQRRLLAAKEAGLRFIPAIIKNLSIREMMEVGYLENLHREELNKLDRIQVFERICNEYPELGRERLAEMLGLDIKELERSKEILKLPIILQEAIRAKIVTERHAFILKDLPDKGSLLKGIEAVYKERLSLEDTKEYVDSLLGRARKYVSARESSHFHHPSCPYVNLIPPEERVDFHSKFQARKAGKIPCMMCM